MPLEVLLLALLVPIDGLILWRSDRRASFIWLSVLFAIFGGLRFAVPVPHFDQGSLSTYNNPGVVTLDGVVDAPPDVRDTYLNLRVNADRLTLPDRSSRPIEGVALVRPARPAGFRYGDRVRVTGQLTAPPEAASCWASMPAYPPVCKKISASPARHTSSRYQGKYQIKPTIPFSLAG